jgi:hypothetical protein
MNNDAKTQAHHRQTTKSTQADEALMPCPFCGAVCNFTACSGAPVSYRITCTKCQTTYGGHLCEDQLREGWNTRHAPREYEDHDTRLAVRLYDTTVPDQSVALCAQLSQIMDNSAADDEDTQAAIAWFVKMYKDEETGE